MGEWLRSFVLCLKVVVRLNIQLNQRSSNTFWEGRASAAGSLALSTQLLCREIRVLLHMRASLLGQRLILIQDAR